MSRVPMSTALTVWLIKPFFYLPWRRNRKAEIVKALRKGRPLLVGTGAWKRHAVVGAFSFEGLCSQTVGTVGGGTDVDCRACKRIIRKAKRLGVSGD